MNGPPPWSEQFTVSGSCHEGNGTVVPIILPTSRTRTCELAILYLGRSFNSSSYYSSSYDCCPTLDCLMGHFQNFPVNFDYAVNEPRKPLVYLLFNL